jgi:hypothetical protein
MTMTTTSTCVGDGDELELEGKNLVQAQVQQASELLIQRREHRLDVH